MTLSDAADWSKVAQMALTVIQAVLVAAWLYLRKEFVGQKHCNAQCLADATARAEINQRLSTLEQALANAPNGRDMSAIKDQLAELSGDIRAMSATTSAQSKAMERVTHQLDLLLENELKGDKR